MLFPPSHLSAVRVEPREYPLLLRKKRKKMGREKHKGKEHEKQKKDKKLMQEGSKAASAGTTE